MAQSTNIVVVTGNLTRDPELRHIPSGTAVCDIGIAVNDREKKGNEWKDRVDFIDVTLWGRTAEICCEYCGKGDSVLIEGKLRLETWEKDGKRNSKLKVVAERLQMLGGKRDSRPQRSMTKTAQDNFGGEPSSEPLDADVPF